MLKHSIYLTRDGPLALNKPTATRQSVLSVLQVLAFRKQLWQLNSYISIAQGKENAMPSRHCSLFLRPSGSHHRWRMLKVFVKSDTVTDIALHGIDWEFNRYVVQNI